MKDIAWTSLTKLPCSFNIYVVISTADPYNYSQGFELLQIFSGQGNIVVH